MKFSHEFNKFIFYSSMYHFEKTHKFSNEAFKYNTE